MRTAAVERAAPVTDRRGLSDIAYGFMASQALFAALAIDLFTQLSAGRRTVGGLSSVTGVPPNRMQTLLHALAGVGLVVVTPRSFSGAGDDPGREYANAPACQ